ncbi:hypothetical protein [Salinisphaera orenii]|uniref:hypothetical protein n=1 Tax=Salinisphaera orenii TaxID=856731 RepID=UPI001FEB3CA9|nr:hypothetical protein [Salinisphaera halophila]
MDHFVKHLCSLGMTVAAATLLTGCAFSPNSADEQAELADSDAAFGYEQSNWDRPFWQRWVDDARAQGRAEGQQAAARAEAPAASSVAVNDDDSGLRPKVGVYIQGADPDSLAAYSLTNALAARAREKGLTLIKPGELDDAVGGSDACAAETPVGCPQLLSIFPGIRGLLVITPETGGSGRMNVETRMRDTDFGIEYDSVSTALNIGPDDIGGSGSDIAVWSERILDMAADRIAIAPWFTHSFALEGDDMYISAGREAGLATGDVLAAHGEGSVVRSPSGRVVAWEPGPAVGRVRVKQFLGPNIAIVEQVSGQRPNPSHRLTLVK